MWNYSKMSKLYVWNLVAEIVYFLAHISTNDFGMQGLKFHSLFVRKNYFK